MADLLAFGGVAPRIADSAFVAPGATLVGDVTVGEEASIWFGAVLRGDHPENGIVVGARTSIQDNCVVHVADRAPTRIGEGCIVGHGATMECCRIGNGTLVGMNAVVLQGAILGEECVVAAGAVVLEGAEIPPRSLVAGVPGRVRKELDQDTLTRLRGGSRHYVKLSRRYREGG